MRRLRVALYRLKLESQKKGQKQIDYRKTFKSDFAFLCFIILTQQTTDQNAYKAAIQLFREYPSIRLIKDAKVNEIASLIAPAGMQLKKAKAIKEIAAFVVINKGKIPNTREALERLPLVGRKTASIILNECFGVGAFPVDTHIKRVLSRITGFSLTEKTAEELITARYKSSDWFSIHNRLRAHGQTTCTSKLTKCSQCPLTDVCAYFNTYRVSQRRDTDGTK